MLSANKLTRDMHFINMDDIIVRYRIETFISYISINSIYIEFLVLLPRATYFFPPFLIPT